MNHYQQHVLTQSKTDLVDLILPNDNVTIQTVAINMVASTTDPRKSGRAGSLWFNNNGLTYMRAFPFTTATVTAPAVRVIGWSKVNDLDLWIPHLIADIGLSLVSNSTTINGDTMYQAETTTRTHGDAKTYNSPATPESGVGFIVDTAGHRVIEFAFRASAASGQKAVVAIGQI